MRSAFSNYGGEPRLLATLGCEQTEKQHNKKCSNYRGDILRAINIMVAEDPRLRNIRNFKCNESHKVVTAIDSDSEESSVVADHEHVYQPRTVLMVKLYAETHERHQALNNSTMMHKLLEHAEGKTFGDNV